MIELIKIDSHLCFIGSVFNIFGVMKVGNAMCMCLAMSNDSFRKVIAVVRLQWTCRVIADADNKLVAVLCYGT